MKFTGKERDTETGLDYFGARYYSGAQGRFTSPDEPMIDPYPEDPQSWNLYSYVRDNPFVNIDADGRGCVDTTGPDGIPCKGDDGDGKGCAEAKVKPSKKPKHPAISEDILPKIVWVEDQLRQRCWTTSLISLRALEIT